VQFFNATWHNLGSKLILKETVSDITGVNIDILTGQEDPQNYSVARRMSWAAKRSTARVEDVA
jgi:hypothetical protein